MKGLMLNVAGRSIKEILEALDDVKKEIERGTPNILTPDNGQGWAYEYDVEDFETEDCGHAVFLMGRD